MPRLYREAPLNSIWEGSGNVNALDVLRALAQASPRRSRRFFAEVDARRRRRPAPRRVRRAACATSSPTSRASRCARGASSRSSRSRCRARCSSATRPPAVADAFCASRLAGDGGLAYGTLPAGVDARAIVGPPRAPADVELATVGSGVPRGRGPGRAAWRCCSTATRTRRTCGRTCCRPWRDAGLARGRARPGRLRRLAAAARRAPARGPTTSRALDDFVAEHGLAPRRAGRPRLGRADRPALGVRPAVRGARAGDHEHRLLPRRQVARPGARGCAPRARASRSSRSHHPRDVRRAAAQRVGEHHRARRSTSTGRATRTTSAARRTSRSTARGELRGARRVRRQARRARTSRRSLLWGAEDAFAPVAGAHRFKREIPDAELVVLEGVGHFLPGGRARARRRRDRAASSVRL